MTDKPDSPKRVPTKGKGTLVKIAVHPEDAERLMKAFRDGKLAELGIISFEMHEEREPTKKKWVQPKRRLPDDSPGDDTPPTRSR